MTKREIAALAIRLLGIYTFVVAISSLALTGAGIAITMQAMAHMRTDRLVNLAYIVPGWFPFLISIVSGVILWFGADRLAVHMIHEDGAILPSTIGGLELRELAFSILGVITIVESTSPLTKALATLYFDYANPIFHQAAHQNTAIIGLSGLIELCIGFSLLLKAGALNNWIASVQAAKPADVNTE